MCCGPKNERKKCLASKVDNPYLITFLIRKPILEWCVAPRTDSKTKHVFRKDRIACSEYDDYPQKMVNRTNWGGGMRDLYDHSTSTRIFTLRMNKIFI